MENNNQFQAPSNLVSRATHQDELGQLEIAPTRDLASSVIEVFKLLSDETRLRIVLLLLEAGELNVRSLCERLNQSQPAVSHHLSLLRVAEFIERRRDGKSNYYHVVQEKLEVFLCLLFRTVPGRASYLQFQDFQVEYHPRVSGIVERTTVAGQTLTSTPSPSNI